MTVNGFDRYFTETRFREESMSLDDDERRSLYWQHWRQRAGNIIAGILVGLCRLVILLVIAVAVYLAWSGISGYLRRGDAPVGIEIRMLYSPHLIA